MKWIGLLALLLRIALAGLFIYAGAIKALNPAAFLADIESYCLVPRALAAVAALYLPWLETVCGLALLVPRARCGARLLLIALMCVFLVAIAAARVRGLDITCACFGPSTGPSSYPKLIARDLLILAALLAIGLKRPLPPAQVA